MSRTPWKSSTKCTSKAKIQVASVGSQPAWRWLTHMYDMDMDVWYGWSGMTRDTLAENTMESCFMHPIFNQPTPSQRKNVTTQTLEILVVPSSRLKLRKKKPRFCGSYPVNRQDSDEGVPGVLLGRYERDRYGHLSQGNPWVFHQHLTTTCRRREFFFGYFWLAGNMKTDRLTR